MLWFDKSKGINFILLWGALLLSGCGLTPMYGTGNGSQNFAFRESSSILVEPIPNREGQVLRNKLRQLLTPYGVPATSIYRLKVSVQTSKLPMAFLKDATPSRYQLQLKATFSLVLTETGESVVAGEAQSFADYNVVLDGDYATLVGEQDAVKRAVTEIAFTIQMQLANYFLLQNPDETIS